MTDVRRATAPRRRTATIGLGAALAGTGLAAGLTGSAAAAPRAASRPAVSHAPARAASKHKLVGLFTLTAGKQNGKKVTGSYFRMLIPGGAGYVPEGSSTYVLLTPGTQGGLRTGVYQPQPSPGFNKNDSLAGKIFKPRPFEGDNFGASTNTTDLQNGGSVPKPSITVSGHKLTGNLAAFSVSWNRLYFNQGSPKPGNTYPGRTVKVTGTYNPKTHKYTLNWRSQIEGGGFNNFTGYWHFVGKFKAS